jgi:hypothetical protein
MLVANPFADRLTFLDNRTRSRRDHTKYLTLIRTVALLHQHQREHKTIEHPPASRQFVEYIEVTPADIAIANRLTHEVLGRTLDELAPQTRRLLAMLDAQVTAEYQKQKMLRSDYRFTRRQVRTWAGWTDFVVRTHLQKLVDLEYVLVHRGGRGQSFVYELLYGGEGIDGKPFALGLIDPDKLETPPAPLVYDGNSEPSRQKFEHEKGQFEGGSSLHSAPIEPGSCAGPSAESPGPAESEHASHAQGVEIAPPVTPSDASQRTDGSSYPPSSLAADSNGQEGHHAA